MKKIVFLLATLLLSTQATAAITLIDQQTRNMDDVHSLGVIYINHNAAQKNETPQHQSEEARERSATYFHAMDMREPGSHTPVRSVTEIYR